MESIAARLKAFLAVGLLFVLAFVVFSLPAHAASGVKEIVILYSGQTHAMLYTCSCPKEKDGGIARRATLVKQQRKVNPEAILVDTGSFFAGGLEDEYTQNTQFDMQRTDINLKAMGLMKFDAAVIGPDEFNFGADFLRGAIKKTGINFLSSNIKMEEVLPFMVKELSGGVKVGLIGATSLSSKQKAAGVEVFEPNPKAAASVAELKKAGANCIVLLSNLTPGEEQSLLENVKGIDILISNNKKQNQPMKAGETLVLNTSWQGRKLGKLTFGLKDGKVANPRSEEIRLSDKVSDDLEVSAALPSCFLDRDCRKEGLVGICKDAGAPAATCLFSEARKFSFTVITVKPCLTCDTDAVVSPLKNQFPGIEVKYLYYPEKKAAELVKELGITGLPAYILGKDVQKDKGFEMIKPGLEDKGGYFILKPEASGVSIFLDRKKEKGKLDIFLSLYDESSAAILANAKDLNPDLHFLAVEVNGIFDAPKGKSEIEEDLRAVCVQKLYPDNFIDYAICRSQNKDSSWWEDCAGGLDIAKIKSCAKGEEGTKLFKENTSLSKQLRIMFGPVYLLDNQEIFTSKGAPSKEELRKILKR